MERDSLLEEEKLTLESSLNTSCSGLMGVPVSFLDKYCPDQFEIVGVANHGSDSKYDLFSPTIGGKLIYKRLLIKHKV